MSAAAAGHGDFEKGDLKDTFAWKALGWTAKTVLFGSAIFAGTFFVEAFMDYGLIHSEAWASSGVSAVATEAMRPVAEGLQGFFASPMGESTLVMMSEFFESVWGFFGVETFADGVVAGVGDAPDLSAVVDGDLGASDLGTQTEFSEDEDLLSELNQS